MKATTVKAIGLSYGNVNGVCDTPLMGVLKGLTIGQDEADTQEIEAEFYDSPFEIVYSGKPVTMTFELTNYELSELPALFGGTYNSSTNDYDGAVDAYTSEHAWRLDFARGNRSIYLYRGLTVGTLKKDADGALNYAVTITALTYSANGTDKVYRIEGENVTPPTPVAPVPTSFNDFYVDATIQHDEIQNNVYVLAMLDDDDQSWVVRVNYPNGSVSYPCGSIGSIDASVYIWGLNIDSDESCDNLDSNNWDDNDRWEMFVDNSTGVQHDKFVDVYLTGACEIVGENDYMASLILTNANGQTIRTIVQGDVYTEINLPYRD